MARTLFIGDIHGEVDKMNALVKYAMKQDAFEQVIQIGDFDIGSDCYSTIKWPFDTPLYFMAGNHDNYTLLNDDLVLPLNVHYLKRGEVIGNTLFIGGAYSVDRHLRVPGIDWFTEEQMSYREYIEIHHKIGDFRLNGQSISTMVCHDAPHFAYHEQFNITDLRQTANTHTVSLGEIFNLAKPSRYIHGHHHVRRSYEYQGCQFESLGTITFYKMSRLEAMYKDCTLVCDI